MRQIVETDSGELVCSCCGLVIEEKPETGHNPIKLAVTDWSGYGMPFLGSVEPGRVRGVTTLPIHDRQKAILVAAAQDISAVNRYCPPDRCPPRIRKDVLDMMRRLRTSRRAANAEMPIRPIAIPALLYLAHENRKVPLKYNDLLAGVGRMRANSIRRQIRELRREFFPEQSTLPSDLARRDIRTCGHGLPPAVLDGADSLVPAAVRACMGSRASSIAAACVLIAFAGGLDEFRRKAGWWIDFKPDACTQAALAKRFRVKLDTIRKTARTIIGVEKPMLTCAACGAEFTAVHGLQKTCSAECSLENRRRRNLRTCAACGLEFMRGSGMQKTCSVKCSIENRRRRNLRTCAACGAEFTAVHGSQKTCSAECSLENRRRRHQQKYGKPARACAVCGAEFRRVNGRQKTCSSKCSIENRRRRHQQKYGKPARACAACGAEFRRADGTQKTCSVKCSIENRRRCVQQQSVKIQLTCVACGTEFMAAPGSQKTCSAECLIENGRRRCRQNARKAQAKRGLAPTG